MQSTVKLRESDPHDAFPIAPDVVPAAWADKVFADITRDPGSRSSDQPSPQARTAATSAPRRYDVSRQRGQRSARRQRPAGAGARSQDQKQSRGIRVYAVQRADRRRLAALWRCRQADVRGLDTAVHPRLRGPTQKTGLSEQPDTSAVQAAMADQPPQQDTTTAQPAEAAAAPRPMRRKCNRWRAIWPRWARRSSSSRPASPTSGQASRRWPPPSPQRSNPPRPSPWRKLRSPKYWGLHRDRSRRPCAGRWHPIIRRRRLPYRHNSSTRRRPRSPSRHRRYRPSSMATDRYSGRHCRCISARWFETRAKKRAPHHEGVRPFLEEFRTHAEKNSDLILRSREAASRRMVASWLQRPVALALSLTTAIFPGMTTTEDIEKAVEQLAPRELARFRAWFETFDAEQFDAAIERDARTGKLDAHADEALAAHRAGRSRDL